MYSAYLDRFTDNEKALLLVDELHKEFHIDISALPSDSKVGTWFLVAIQGDEFTSIQINEGKTVEMKLEIDDKIQRLKSKKNSRFKRN